MIFTVILLIALLLVGTWLFIRGRRPRRVGDTPHCRRCDYNLTGLKHPTCPECGAWLFPRTIAIGDRHPRKGRIAGGLMMMAIAGTGLGVLAFGVVKGTNWNPYLPDFVLVRKLDDSALAPGVWAELARRQTNSGRANILSDGFLVQWQVDSWVHQVQIPLLQVRPRVQVGDKVPWKLVPSGSIPNPLMLRLANARILCDGREVAPPELAIAEFAAGGFAAYDREFSCADIGRHEVTIEATAEVYINSPNPILAPVGFPPPTKPVASWPVRIAGSFKGVPVGESKIRHVSNDALQDEIRQTVRPVGLAFWPWPPWPPERAHATIMLNGCERGNLLPVDVAFRMFARVEGKEYLFGYARGKRGSLIEVRENTPKLQYTGPIVPTADVVFRSSDEVARGSTDIDEIWDGEIVYKDVPVRNFIPSGGKP